MKSLMLALIALLIINQPVNGLWPIETGRAKG
jgi:hypothetical protein